MFFKLKNCQIRRRKTGKIDGKRRSEFRNAITANINEKFDERKYLRSKLSDTWQTGTKTGIEIDKKSITENHGTTIQK